MKSSVSPPALLATAILLSFLSFFAPVQVSAQDTLIFANGQRREGEILGVRDGRIRFKAGPAETSIPLEQVTSARMTPPAKFEEMLAAWQTGDTAKTLSLLKPLVENFLGLPAAWVERAAALLGTVLVESGDLPAAEAAFAAFQEAYPEAQSLADLGVARLAVAQGNFAEAREKVLPIVETARQTLFAESGKSAEFGQALYLMGQIQENEGNYPEALDHYLLAVTVFYEDAAVTAKARERSDALASEKNATVP